MTTRKYIKKEMKKEQLISSGYKVFDTHGCTADQLFAIIVIACNKINPDQPARAFKTVAESERKLSHGYSIRPNAWNKGAPRQPVSEDTETDGNDQLDDSTSCHSGEI